MRTKEMFAVYGITSDRGVSGCEIFLTKKEAYKHVRNIFAELILHDCEEQFGFIKEKNTDTILEQAEMLGYYSEDVSVSNFWYGDMHFVIEPVYIPLD